MYTVGGYFVQSNELCHHGILGMKWGIRRYQPYGTAYVGKTKGKFLGNKYQNSDGTLTDKGKKKYYKTDKDGFDILNKKGQRYNRKSREKVNKLADKMYNKVTKTEKYKKEFEKYKELNKQNNTDYLQEREKWLKDEGKYKGKDYYEFKDISADKWITSKEGKAEAESRKKLEKMFEDAAKKYPQYSKTYTRLSDIELSSLFNQPVKTKQVNYGKEMVRLALSRAEAESRKEHKDSL